MSDNHPNGELNQGKKWKDDIKALKGQSALLPNSNCTQPISKIIVVTQYDLRSSRSQFGSRYVYYIFNQQVVKLIINILF
jgi:hypothetical protein